MDTAIIDLDREIRFYQPDLTGLYGVSQDIAGTMQAQANPWHRMTENEVGEVTKVALYLYNCLTHQRYLAQKGKFFDVNLVEQFSSLLRIPRFLRDAIRETCRPMEANGEIWLPELPLPSGTPKTIQVLFGDVNLSRFSTAIEKLQGLDLVFLEPENLRPQPLSFWSVEQSKLFCLLRLPDWRMEAMMRLKHCQHSPPSPPPEVKVPEQILEADRPSFLNANITGRFVGALAFFAFDGVHQTLRYGFITGASRFPTDEEHSKTPPSKSKATFKK